MLRIVAREGACEAYKVLNQLKEEYFNCAVLIADIYDFTIRPCAQLLISRVIDVFL